MLNIETPSTNQGLLPTTLVAAVYDVVLTIIKGDLYSIISYLVPYPLIKSASEPSTDVVRDDREAVYEIVMKIIMSDVIPEKCAASMSFPTVSGISLESACSSLWYNLNVAISDDIAYRIRKGVEEQDISEKYEQIIYSKVLPYIRATHLPPMPMYNPYTHSGQFQPQPVYQPQPTCQPQSAYQQQALMGYAMPAAQRMNVDMQCDALSKMTNQLVDMLCKGAPSFSPYKSTTASTNAVCEFIQAVKNNTAGAAIMMALDKATELLTPVQWFTLLRQYLNTTRSPYGSSGPV